MIGILSDAHGNFSAFEKAILLLERLGAEQFIFLGDALGYFPNTKVLDAIIHQGDRMRCVLGNHEDLIIKNEFHDNYEPVYQHKVLYKKLTDTQLKNLMSWPKSLSFSTQVGDVLCIHGSPNNQTYDYVYPEADLSKYDVLEKYVFMGHTHLPFIEKYHETIYINVGSCGLPRDHGTLGSGVLFDEQTGNIRVIRFDIKSQLKLALAESSNIHSSVLALQARKPETFLGEIIK